MSWGVPPSSAVLFLFSPRGLSCILHRVSRLPPSLTLQSALNRRGLGGARPPGPGGPRPRQRHWSTQRSTSLPPQPSSLQPPSRHLHRHAPPPHDPVASLFAIAPLFGPSPHCSAVALARRLAVRPLPWPVASPFGRCLGPSPRRSAVAFARCLGLCLVTRRSSPRPQLLSSPRSSPVTLARCPNFLGYKAGHEQKSQNFFSQGIQPSSSGQRYHRSARVKATATVTTTKARRSSPR